MEATKENLNRVRCLLGRAMYAGLMGADWLRFKGAEFACRAYNGIGPEFLPGTLRDRVTGLLSLFEPAALIHDCRCELSDGSREWFDFSNREFRYNCLELANQAYPFWSWKRYRARAVANLLYDAVNSDAIGWRAWIDAAKKNV